MKNLIFTIAAVLSFTLNAQAEMTATKKLVCTPATKNYPFDSLNITIKAGESEAKSVTISGRLSKQASSDRSLANFKCQSQSEVDNCALRIEKSDLAAVKNKVGKDIDIYTLNLYMDFRDWAGTQIDIAFDDIGLSAFVDFKSDGASIRSFYNCK